MDKKEICIATITWARNEIEEKLLKESLEKLATLAIPVFITDGGSASSFLEFLKRFPHFTILTTPDKGVQAQAIRSITGASETGVPFIFYTEPDKKDFFSKSLLPLLSKVDTGETTGIILASRTPLAFSSFPSFQQMTETTINNCCAEVINKSFDYTYGPFLLNSKPVPYLNQLNTDIGWGWRPYIFNIAHRLGYSVDAIDGDFNCPPDQREDDTKERIYRMRQLEQNIRGIVLSTEAPL